MVREARAGEVKNNPYNARMRCSQIKLSRALPNMVFITKVIKTPAKKKNNECLKILLCSLWVV
jgi:hypothetical protein